MDPNQTLKDMREAMAQMRTEGTFTGNYLKASTDLLEAVEAMDGWLSQGGVAPMEWIVIPSYPGFAEVKS